MKKPSLALTAESSRTLSSSKSRICTSASAAAPADSGRAQKSRRRRDTPTWVPERTRPTSASATLSSGAAATFSSSRASSSGESTMSAGAGSLMSSRAPPSSTSLRGLVLAAALVALIVAAPGGAPEPAAPHVALAGELVPPLLRRRRGQLGEPGAGGGQRGPVGGGDLEHAEERARGAVDGVVGRGGADHAPALGAHPEGELARVPPAAEQRARDDARVLEQAGERLAVGDDLARKDHEPGARLGGGVRDRAHVAADPGGDADAVARHFAHGRLVGRPGEHAHVADPELAELGEQAGEHGRALPGQQRGAAAAGGGGGRDDDRRRDGRGVAHGRARSRRARSDSPRRVSHAAGQGRWRLARGGADP